MLEFFLNNYTASFFSEIILIFFSTPKRTTKSKKSEVWQYFEETTKDNPGKKKCKSCHIFVTCINTSNAWSHIKNHHKTLIEPSDEESSSTSDSSLKQSIAKKRKREVVEEKDNSAKKINSGRGN